MKKTKNTRLRYGKVCFFLELDDNKIAVETDMFKNDSTRFQKYASLQFEKIRFVFDV